MRGNKIIQDLKSEDAITFSSRSDKESNVYENLRTVDRTPSVELCTVSE